MVPEGAGCLRNRRWSRLAAWIGALLGVVLLTGFAGSAQSTAGIDIEIVSLHVGWTYGLDQALVGDTVRINARLRNLGTESVGQFTVDFFFTETITGEHGKIGSQTVSGLASGEETRPVISFETTGFTPGIYVFSAEADAMETLGESNRCNNVTPLEACDGTAAERSDKYTLTVLQSGRHLSQLALQGTFPVCRMGELDTRWTFNVYNVGTESLQLISSSNLDVAGYYRLALTPPANVFETLSGSEDLGVLGFIGSSGSQGSITITLDYASLASEFRPSDREADDFEVIGRSDQAQLRVSVAPTGEDAGLARDAFFPDQYKLSYFYSTVDAWTFPAREQCRCEDQQYYEDIATVPVEPVVEGGRVFHIVTTSAGSDRLHVLKVDTGEEQAVWSASGELTAPVVAYDNSGAVDIYRIYIGSSDGSVHALQYTLGETELTSLWQSETGIVTERRSGNRPTTFLLLSSDAEELIIGSEAGAFVLDPTDGAVLRRHTDYEVTSLPAYADATGTLWMASGSDVYAINPNGSVCSFEADDPITTSLELNQPQDVVFLGTDGGDLLALGVGSGTACTLRAREEALLWDDIIGLDVYSTDEDALIYLTSTTGEVYSIEYKDSQEEFRGTTEGERTKRLGDIMTPPAVFASDEARAVLVTGLDRRTDRPVLQVWEDDLDDLAQVNVWGNNDVWFAFLPEEAGVVPSALLAPVVAVVDIDNESAYGLVGCSNGYLYAFDLGQLW